MRRHDPYGEIDEARLEYYQKTLERVFTILTFQSARMNNDPQGMSEAFDELQNEMRGEADPNGNPLYSTIKMEIENMKRISELKFQNANREEELERISSKLTSHLGALDELVSPEKTEECND